MNTLETLTDAFSELERRADVVTAGLSADPLTRAHAKRHARPLLIAASVAAVLVLSVGAAILVGRPSPAHEKAGGPPLGLSASSNVSSRPAASASDGLPATPDELATRLRAVLGSTATFTVTETGHPVTMTMPAAPGRTPVATHSPATTSVQASGAAIVGTLTSHGVTGGFDLQIDRTPSGVVAQCDRPGTATCSVRTFADGATIAVDTIALEGETGGVTYQVEIARPDGIVFLMHVSNERSPKGDSLLLAAHPPLTTTQMTSILMSPTWW